MAEEENGTLIIIELQFTEEIDYFHLMLFGSSKAIAEHIGKGLHYKDELKLTDEQKFSTLWQKVTALSILRRF